MYGGWLIGTTQLKVMGEFGRICDLVPSSLGVEARDTRRDIDIYDPIIPKGSDIPCEREKIFGFPDRLPEGESACIRVFTGDEKELQ
jgi:hypothetical protein